MKNLLLLFFIATSFVSFSQNKETKRHLKKMGYDMSEFAYTDEKVRIYPRGLIYSLNELDSVFYFACFDSDVKDVEAYFNGSKTIISKMSSGSAILRDGVDFEESIFLEHFSLKVDHLKNEKGKPYKLRDDVNYVILYYWKNSVMAEDYYENFRKIKQIALEHSELKIQVIAVSTDKPN
jgi:hypothetical protein